MSDIKDILINLGYSNITEDSKNYRMKPIYRDSSSSTVLSVRKDTGSFIDFSKQMSGSLRDLVKISLNYKSEDEAVKWLNDYGDGSVTQRIAERRPEIKEAKVFD